MNGIIPGIAGQEDTMDIFGTAESDIIVGTPLSDRIYGGGGSDFIRARAGDDEVYGEDGDDLLLAGPGSNVIDGGNGWDRMSYANSFTGVTVSLLLAGTAQDTGAVFLLGTTTSDTLINIEHLTGSSFDDVLTGDNSANWLWGGLGGNEILSGEGGDDLLMVGIGNHSVNGGDGTDTLSIFSNLAGDGGVTSGVSLSLRLQHQAQSFGHGSLILSGVENLSGSAYADALTGDDHNNILAGAGGSDQLFGGAGNDLLYGDGAIRPNTGGLGYSGPVTTLLSGAGAGDDFIDGGPGSDTLVGGAGADVLRGGQQSDTFVFLSLTDSRPDAPDLIIDPDRRDDWIDLSAIDANPATVADDAFTIVRGGFTGAAGELLVEWDPIAGISRLSVDVDGDRVADMIIDLAVRWTPAWEDMLIL